MPKKKPARVEKPTPTRMTSLRLDPSLVKILQERAASLGVGWQTLLKIPVGQATTYSDIASHLGNAKASRAVGAAVGKNPISFVVPCHRVLGKSGGLCGYHWGLTRKQAILGWEAGLLTGKSAAA